MASTPHPRRHERGFTLVELMVSLVLFSVAIAGILSVAVTMSSAFRDQRAIIATESSARSPMDFMTDVLRNASPGVASGQITDYAATGAKCTTPAALTVTNNLAASPTVVGGTDSLDVVFASGGLVTSTTQTWDGTGTLQVLTPAGFAIGDYVVVTNTNVGEIAKITGIGGNLFTTAPLACTTNMPTGGYAVGSLVIRAFHATFTISPSSTDTLPIPTLMMSVDPYAAVPVLQPLSDGIDDMQIALGVDGNADGALTEVGLVPNDDEWSYNVAGEAPPVGAIRAIRVTMVARAVNGNIGANNATYFRPKAEDNPASLIPDTFRRRVLQSTVEIRNLQGSP